MKKLFYICTILIFTSCSGNFLELSPEHFENEGNFFQTEDDFEQAINGVYPTLRAVSGRHAFLMGEMRSDNTHYTRNPSDRGFAAVRGEEIADFIIDSQNGYVNDMYNSCFYGVSRANIVLTRIEKADLREDFKNRIIGEAKFIRGFLYFQLVQCFGGVPLHLTEVKAPSGAFLPRASVDDVYEVIISDVTDAIAKLPVVNFPQNGAATQGAAKMLYAYVLMTKPNRDYAEAEKQLRNIMEMGYELLPEYADVFSTTNKNHKESIFDIQYMMGDQYGQQSDWLYYFIPKTTDAEIITGILGSNTLTSGGWNVPTPEMIDSYEPGDKRLNPSVAVAVGHMPEDGSLGMIVEGVFNVGDPAIKNYELAYPFINKYRHPHSKVFNTDDNWPVYRYSDCLLLLAECLVEQGRTAEAVPYVNQVRNRAGLPSVTTVNAKIVADERRHELAFENHRWYDLIRTGMAIDVMTEYGKYIKSIDSGLADRTYQIKGDYLLYPIPYREIQLNNQLTQNPGYN